MKSCQQQFQARTRTLLVLVLKWRRSDAVASAKPSFPETGESVVGRHYLRRHHEATAMQLQQSNEEAQLWNGAAVEQRSCIAVQQHRRRQ